MTEPVAKVPYFKISGTPEQIGFQHGSMLKERVKACYDYYTQKLMMGPIDLKGDGERFLAVIEHHYPQYGVEIRALARGAEMEAWQVAVLNARTEIFIKAMVDFVGECTTCFFRKEKVFGENWDWMAECEDLIVLLEIEREDGHRVLMLAEPGIIGKIGLNSKGLAVGLNILHGKAFEVALPVHILLRAVLDSNNLAQAQHLLETKPACTFSNVFVADEHGDYLNYEFKARKRNLLQYGKETPIHTNHYLGEKCNEQGNPMYESSQQRLTRARQLVSEQDGESIQKMKRILLDTSGSEAICAEFRHHMHYRVGTVSSIIVDLPQRKMLVTKGSPLRHDYQEHQL